MSFKKKGGGAPRPEPVALPDIGALWKNYSGWISNINRRNEGASADVRARLSAAGAAPELIKMQTEHLESQRTKEIGEIQSGPTFKQLQEIHGIAMGGGSGPYASAPAGAEQFRGQAATQKAPEAGTPPVYNYMAHQSETSGPMGMITELFKSIIPGRSPIGMEQYFTEFYGAPDAGQGAETPEQAATKRAKGAAGGVTPGAAGGGASSGTAANPWVDEQKLFS